MKAFILRTRFCGTCSKNFKLGVHRQLYYFSNLPKPSRFSQQTGLQGEFQSLRVKVQKHEKDTVNNYEKMILISVCIFGSLITYLTFKFNLSAEIKLFFNLVALSLSIKDPQQKLKSLQKVIEFQESCNKNRNYQNVVSIKILNHCLKEQVSVLSSQLKEKYINTLEKALVNNLKNQKNINRYSSYTVYRRYFEKLLNLEGYSESQNLRRMLRYFAFKPQDTQVPFQVQLQLLYLLAKLTKEGKMRLNNEQKESLRVNLKQLKQKLISKQKTLQSESESDSSRRLLLDPYLFECNIHRKWVVFTEQNLKG